MRRASGRAIEGYDIALREAHRLAAEYPNRYWLCKRLARHGLFVGPSSGAFVHAALQLAAQQEYRIIVTVLSDTGERYVSTGLWKAETAVAAR